MNKLYVTSTGNVIAGSGFQLICRLYNMAAKSKAAIKLLKVY